MKRILTTILAFALLVGLSTTAHAAKITEEDVLSKALDNANQTRSSVKNLEVETDDDTGNYEIEFKVKGSKTEYSYKISATSGKIIKKSVDYNVICPKSGKKIGENAAISIVAETSGIEVSVIKKGKIRFCKKKYDIQFKNDGMKYEYEVVACTGKINEYEWKVVK